MAQPVIFLRQAIPSDASTMARLDRASWPEALATTAAQFVARILAYPEGQLVATANSRVVAAASAQRIRSDFLTVHCHRYELLTDSNRFTRSHSDEGEIYQLIGVGVLPEFRGMNLGRKLVDRQIEFARSLAEVTRIIGFTRPAGYHIHRQMPIEEYIDARDEEGRALDPVLAFHLDAGARIVSIHADFRRDDYESGGYGVMIEYPCG